jgi:hypothetical protein
VTRYPKASDISSPPCLLRLLPAGAVAGWGLHPLESAALSRRTPIPAIAKTSRQHLDIAVAEDEAEIRPNRVPDNRRPDAMTAVGGRADGISISQSGPTRRSS